MYIIHLEEKKIKTAGRSTEMTHNPSRYANYSYG